jgi:excisionase family DNA binding protein
VAEPVRRITLTPNEAAAALGVGRTFLYEHVLPGVPVIRLGKKRLILVSDLVRWAERNATRLPLEGIS